MRIAFGSRREFIWRCGTVPNNYAIHSEKCTIVMPAAVPKPQYGQGAPEARCRESAAEEPSRGELIWIKERGTVPNTITLCSVDACR